ncbi:hypothetical protein [Methylorubrum suomiense]|uniref:hypothetical protein n=1 Tax=Methylorubrum suomiense TaxID=144191 RepID=UPI0010F4A01A|nr:MULTISPECIES: hypothetical protein [Methylobacteriaceae]
MYDFKQTYVEKTASHRRVVLVEAAPIIASDLTDAGARADRHALGPPRRSPETRFFLLHRTMLSIVFVQEQRDGAGWAMLGNPRRRGMPRVGHAACTEMPGRASELRDIPFLSRPAWTDDIVDTVAPPLPARSRP